MVRQRGMVDKEAVEDFRQAMYLLYTSASTTDDLLKLTERTIWKYNLKTQAAMKLISMYYTEKSATYFMNGGK